ncbi:MAG: S-adenosyl-l-methionine hydroxide adenosyltransferase family protein [Thermodesulfobacteriota bacterium]
MGRVITVTTDFGLIDPYVGIMKGVMLAINPEARFVDITHMVEPGDITEGALALEVACVHFPAGTIHLAVVDPGVGGGRRPIAVETENYLFVGPDNGLLSLAAASDGKRRVVELTNKEFFPGPASATFHGRDVFGPVAAHLSLGADPGALGAEITDMAAVEVPAPVSSGETLTGRVIHVDRFGNLITNVTRGDVPLGAEGETEVAVRGVVISGISGTYSSVAEGELAALFGSSGRLEVACNGGSASRTLGAAVGEPVTVRPGRL